jgi:hypothetical protein
MGAYLWSDACLKPEDSESVVEAQCVDERAGSIYYMCGGDVMLEIMELVSRVSPQ